VSRNHLLPGSTKPLGRDETPAVVLWRRTEKVTRVAAASLSHEGAVAVPANGCVAIPIKIPAPTATTRVARGRRSTLDKAIQGLAADSPSNPDCPWLPKRAASSAALQIRDVNYHP
jgi:hypothetical protein